MLRTPVDGSFIDVGSQLNTMMDSFVDLKKAGGAGGSGAGTLQTLAHLFEIATTCTHVDHPLCVNCVALLTKELEKEVNASQLQADAYRAALIALESGEHGPGGGGPGGGPSAELMTEEELEKELALAAAEEKLELERGARLEADLSKVQLELAALEEESQRLKQEEEAHWQRCNARWLAIRDATEERDALAEKTAVAARHLEDLRRVNVFQDAFHIWFEGPFGTISGFRLGRRREEVSWEELNTAWGQAVLLLDMLMRLYPDYVCAAGTLKPMASRPVVSDGKSDYQLYGPVSKMWSGSYDRAMVLYVACLHDFAQFARARDERRIQAAGMEGREAVLRLPNAVDVERATVGGLSIRYGIMVGNHDNWNKALKLMLVNLKVLLHWVTKDQGIVADRGSADSSGWGALSGSLSRPVANMAASMAAHPASEASSRFQGSQSMFHARRR